MEVIVADLCLGVPDLVMHKNQLQEHVQKCGWPLPVYEIHNEGFAHAPKFRSTLWVNGKEYKSRLTYPHKKDAEQDAAELALKSLVSNENKKNEEHCKILPVISFILHVLILNVIFLFMMRAVGLVFL